MASQLGKALVMRTVLFRERNRLWSRWFVKAHRRGLEPDRIDSPRLPASHLN